MDTVQLIAFGAGSMILGGMAVYAHTHNRAEKWKNYAHDLEKSMFDMKQELFREHLRANELAKELSKAKANDYRDAKGRFTKAPKGKK